MVMYKRNYQITILLNLMTNISFVKQSLANVIVLNRIFAEGMTTTTFFKFQNIFFQIWMKRFRYSHTMNTQFCSE